ncbi:uncharacterized protein BDZ99DRAFT_140934 [Mytilinidion resinicola]|uniref:Uncharacterized protein n=1 Tax=Mytilinidion resinicola TaxID=574789 RepID=A0A6A6Z6K0_9PEZI|nr:uncharacterized protein BDZ99DRAFT_140934 [Mytilinidion resinicola]KAF2816660.1 hypothetical protein BDZ99DRAFT_140934 [Mytilinidion resinicola]
MKESKRGRLQSRASLIANLKYVTNTRVHFMPAMLDYHWHSRPLKERVSNTFNFANPPFFLPKSTRISQRDCRTRGAMVARLIPVHSWSIQKVRRSNRLGFKSRPMVLNFFFSLFFFFFWRPFSLWEIESGDERRKGNLLAE